MGKNKYCAEYTPLCLNKLCSVQVHLGDEPAGQGCAPSDICVCLQGQQLSPHPQLWEPLQSQAASQDSQVLRGVLWWYDATGLVIKLETIV